MNPSSSCNTVLILGNGNGFLTSRSFNLLKSVRNRTVPFFFGCINEGAAHSDVGCHSSTPNSTSLFISLRIVSLWIRGIGKALLWYGVSLVDVDATTADSGLEILFVSVRIRIFFAYTT